MEFFGNHDEYLIVSTLDKFDTDKVNKNIETTLSVYWNKINETIIYVDGIQYVLKPNQLVFLTEFHKVDISKIEEINFIKFNRNFYCIDNHDSQVGCKGILFFGASQMPILTLENENIKKFEILWNVFESEISHKDDFQVEMLQMLLKRFLILSTRIFRLQNKYHTIQETKVDTIRNYNFLVEVHYKTKHSVVQYAELMNKPAKSLTNLFAINFNKSPLKIIQDRILLEAKRYLIYSDRTIKETSFELGFDDMQSFSRFFKNKEGISPKEFKNLHK